MTARTAAWHTATVVASRPETATARRIELDVPTWPGNEAGSHLDVRLTAPDGYQASRSYSLASSGDGTRVTLAVDEIPDGEVSPFLVHDLRDALLLDRTALFVEVRRHVHLEARDEEIGRASCRERV